MQNNKIIIVFILLGNSGFCLEESTNEKDGVVENKKTITKNLYHFDVFGITITTEDIHFYERNTKFAVLSNR